MRERLRAVTASIAAALGVTESLRRRLVVGTAVVTGFGMIALTVLVQVVLNLIVDRDIDGVLADRADAVTSTLVATGGRLHARETPTSALDQYAWIYDDQGHLVEGSVRSAPVDGQLGRLRSVTAPTSVESEDFRLLATPVSLSSGSVSGVVIVAEPLGPYERTERNALVVSIAFGFLVVAGVTVVVAMAVRRALRPVAVMAARADDWSEHDLSRRFDLGPGGDEITALGRTLDALLERVSRVILGEQRLSSELAHELRTPLTAVRGEAELALSRRVVDPATRESLERIVEAATHMAETISTLMTMSRGPGRLHKSARLDDALAASVGSVLEDAHRAAVDVELEDAIAETVLAVPDSAVARIVAPVLDNALRYKTERVHIGATVDAHDVRIFVDDDGPGLGAVAAQDLFSAGIRHPESPGAGLGLALAKRLAVAVGGDVDHVPHPSGTRFVVTLPRA